MKRRRLKRGGLQLAYLALGLALLAWVLSNTELDVAWQQVQNFSLAGLCLVFGLYFVEFACDVAVWQTALTSVPSSVRWLRRLFLARIVGEVFNEITPTATLGGEPVKAVLLKRYYGVDYQSSAASLLLSKTINLIALVLFLAVGLTIVFRDARIPESYRLVSAIGLGAFMLAISGFYLVQRHRISSRLSARLSRWRYARPLAGMLHHIEAFDARLAAFYTTSQTRFGTGLGLAFCNWIMGTLGTWVTLYFLGVPVGLTEAWLIEAFTQLVRAGTFFIPAGIGAQEGAMVLVTGLLTGNAAAGLAASLIRRFRSLVWVLLGIVLGLRYSRLAMEGSAGG